MSQSKRQSFSEAVFNTAIGYGVNFAANLLVLPLFGFTPSLRQNLAMGVLYTGISVVRGYAVRRMFNKLH